MVSLKIREFTATNLSEKEQKHTELKPATLKGLLRNRKNTAPRHDGMSYQMKITTIIRNN